MNRRWTLPLAVALLAAAVTYALTWGLSRRGAADTDCLKDLSFLTHELSLNAEQAADLKTLQATLGATLADCCRNHCVARARLAQMLASEAGSRADVDTLVADMAKAYEESEWATVNHIRAVRALLNAEQRPRFDRMITNSMCGVCNMPAGGTAPDCEPHE